MCWWNSQKIKFYNLLPSNLIYIFVNLRKFFLHSNLIVISPNKDKWFWIFNYNKKVEAGFRKTVHIMRGIFKTCPKYKQHSLRLYHNDITFHWWMRGLDSPTLSSSMSRVRLRPGHVESFATKTTQHHPSLVPSELYRITLHFTCWAMQKKFFRVLLWAFKHFCSPGTQH